MIPGADTPGTLAKSDISPEFDTSVLSPLVGLLADPTIARVYLMIAYPWDPVTGSTVPVYLSDSEFQTVPSDNPSNQVFFPILQSGYNIQFSLFGTDSITARPKPAYGDITIINSDGSYDNLTRYSWKGRDITIYLGPANAPFASFTAIFKGTAAGLTWNLTTINIQLADLQALFAKPLQSELYTPSALRFSSSASVGGLATMASPSGTMTIEGWAKAGTSASTIKWIAGWRNLAAPGGRGVFFTTTGANRVAFVVANNAGTVFQAVDTVSQAVNTWFHYAAVLDVAGGNMYLYINRVLRATTAISGVWTTTLPVLGIGKFPDTPGGNFDGVISELRIWSTARSLSQIGTNMYLSFNGTEANLYAYYPMREGMGTTTIDKTIGAHTMTIGNASWDTGDWQQPGVLGQPKPVTIGQVPQRLLRLVDPNAPGSLVYQGHHRSIQAFDVVYHAGVPLVFNTDYTVDNNRGYVFLLFSPTGRITADMRGDNVGGYVYTRADICRRIAVVYGGLIDPDQIDTDSIALTNLQDSSVYEFWCDDSRSIGDSLDMLMDGGWWVFNRTAIFSIGVLTAPNDFSQGHLTQNDIVDNTIIRLSTPEPSKRQRVGYHRLGQVQAPTELAGAVSDANRLAYGQEYQYDTSGEDLSILTGYPLATDIPVLTQRYDKASAQAESLRRQLLYGGRQDIYKVTLVNGLFQYWLGDTVSLTYVQEVANLPAGVTRKRWDLNNRLFIVIGLVEAVSSSRDIADVIQLTLWGLQPPGSLLVDANTGDELLIDASTGDVLLTGDN